MIRRDYILQMIEECIQALTQIRALRHGRRWEEARQAVDAQCEKLAAAGARNLAQLSETELLARLALDQPTQAVRARLFLVITLLQEAGDIAAAEGRMEEAREIYLKALHLLLDVSAQDDPGGHPAFVPRVEGLVHCLAHAPVPIRTQVLLMRYYESTGQLAKAEDTLFSVLDATTNDPASVEFGAAFYRRILRQNDATLMAGNLPRAEAEEGLQELQRREVKAAIQPI
jgi:tetratricopeptide (TPR) repeat protein